MRDSEVVASIVAGDPEGLAVAYDKYAGDLYGYCRSLLHQPDDAADAVQDTFVIAASKLAGLREPDRLRAWLFAVARNECLHRLKSRRTAALQDIPEPADENVDIGVEAERAEAIALVRAAADGLNDGERDVIKQLWHGLEVPEVAAVLGVSRNHAWSLFSRARDQLEASVGVLLVGRSGRRDCAALDGLLGDWDGRLTARLRRRVGKHIDQCLVCSERRRRELTPAMLYGLAPGGVLALAALRGATTQAGAAHLAGVRDAVLAPGSGAHAATGRAAASSFTGTGFPKPMPSGHLGLLPRPHVSLPLAGGTVVVAVAAAAVVTAVVPGHGPVHPGPSQRPPIGVALPAAVPTAPSGPGGASRPASPGASGPAAGGPATAAGGSPAGMAAAPASTAPDGGRPPGTTGPVATGPAGPGTTPAVAPPSAPVITPTPTAAATAAPSASPSAGTLTVSPTTVLLTPLLGGTLTLTAKGGPVSWSVSGPTSLLGQLTVSPAAGTLSAGQSVTLRITVNGLASLDSQLTIEPGGQVVTVVLGLL